MKCVAVAVLLSVVSLGSSAPSSSCDSLLKPVIISKEDLLGRWLHIGSSSDIPGSRSLGHMTDDLWFNISETTQSDVLNIIQAQRMSGECFTFVYNVTFENSTVTMEHPFYMKEVFLATDSPDSLVSYGKIFLGKNTFTSLYLSSRRRSVSPAAVEILKKQAECLRLPSPMMLSSTHEMCPDTFQDSWGLDALLPFLTDNVVNRVARLMDTIFDIFVN
ncbi:uncharacterized protein LOC125019432 [Mugil cephalus]|uniref:uncharacterized protein LOC125019432 n=1 Tax=Mugil cephalus TaxID=48193 RepID=UPI001FB6D767|nr:uncharacterized protein LOC125019432 [Mugil cephalus]